MTHKRWKSAVKVLYFCGAFCYNGSIPPDGQEVELHFVR